MGHTREEEKRAGDFLYAVSLRSQRGFARAVPAARRPVPGNVAAAVGHETGDNSGRPLGDQHRAETCRHEANLALSRVGTVDLFRCGVSAT